MNGLRQFNRSDIVMFKERDGLQNIFKCGVNIQNHKGNEMSSTIIVCEIELVKANETSEDYILLEEYKEENKKMIINVRKLKTISKKEERIIDVIGIMPYEFMKILNEKLNNKYVFSQQLPTHKIAFVNVELDSIVGSEQGGRRPALIVDEFEEDGQKYYTIAFMTSKIKKISQPTHVMYEPGEGGLEINSIALFEQMSFIKKDKLIKQYNDISKDKLRNNKIAFAKSLGLADINRKMVSGA